MKKCVYPLIFSTLFLLCGFFASLLNPLPTFSNQEWSGVRPPNCRCHSKNPQMVKMHEPFGVKDCLVCHQRETMQMKDKGEEGKRKKMEKARQQKKEEPVCKGCHALKDGYPDSLKGKK